MSSPAAALGGMTLAELRAELTACGHPDFRAQQIRRHSWPLPVSGFAEMSSLPSALRAELSQRLDYLVLRETRRSTADRGLTVKLLLEARDGQAVETVVIRHPDPRRPRTTVCVSSQVGCAVGCVFCATGQLGLLRQLNPAEIVDQVRLAAGVAASAGWTGPLHVVFMGMGEPLQNYSAVVRAISLLQDWGISPRRVVVSTSGLVPEIDRLATLGLPLRLAISLHAADDETRNRLVPLNRKYPIQELAAAATRFARATSRRVSLEYVLIAGVNDRREDARALAQLALRVGAHVNLIPMNSIDHSELHAPGEARCRAFAEWVGARASLRFSRGARVTAGCGQLRAALRPEPRRLARAAARLA